MPEQLQAFFSLFFEVDVQKLLNEQNSSTEELLDETLNDDMHSKDSIKLLKIKSLYQIIFSLINFYKKNSTACSVRSFRIQLNAKQK